MSARERAPFAGVAQVERYLTWIITGFGVCYSLQTLDGLAAGWPAMRGPLGVVVVALVGGSCCVPLLALRRSARTRAVFTAAVALFVVGALVWPFALHGPVPSSPFPWLTSVWPVEAVLLCGATRRIPVPLLATAAAAVVLSALLLGPGRVPMDGVVGAVLPMCVICAVLVLLIGALRHRIRHAERSRAAALAEYERTQRDAATEAERARTDALVHDSVLTTLLSAAAADTAEDEDLVRRMALNAVRVLAHVTRAHPQQQLLSFALLLRRARAIAPAAFAAFTVDVERIGSLALPPAAADAVLEAMVEAMDNSVQHAGDAGRSLTALPLGPDGVRVVVADDGAGFDVDAALAAQGGLHRLVVERMRQVVGRADVASTALGGTRVTISWGSAVIAGTRPLVSGEVAG